MDKIQKEVKAFQQKIKDFAVLTGFQSKERKQKFFFIEKGSSDYNVEADFSNGVCHNSSITLKVFNQNNLPVECFFCWNSRGLGERHEEEQQDEFKNLTNCHDFSATEINFFVTVTIRPKHKPSTEMICRIGPIEMDPDTKFTVQNVLYSGIVNMPVKESKTLESVGLIITPQQILIRSGQQKNENIKILNHLQDVQIEFNKKNGPISERQFSLIFHKRAVVQNSSLLVKIENFNRIDFQAESRQCRDYIYIVRQSLAAKQTFIDEKIIQNIHNDPKSYIQDFKQFTNAILEYIKHQQIQQHYHQVLNKLQSDKNQLASEVESMEEECSLIISTYKKILEEQGINGGEAIEYQTRKDYRNSRRDLNEENLHLKERVEMLEEELQLVHNLHAGEVAMSSRRSQENGSGMEKIDEEQVKRMKKKLEEAYEEQHKLYCQIEQLQEENKNISKELSQQKKEVFQMERECNKLNEVCQQLQFELNSQFVKSSMSKQIQQQDQVLFSRQWPNEDFLKLQLSTSTNLSKSRSNLSANSRSKIFENTPTRMNTPNNKTSSQNMTGNISQLLPQFSERLGKNATTGNRSTNYNELNASQNLNVTRRKLSQINGISPFENSTNEKNEVIYHPCLLDNFCTFSNNNGRNYLTTSKTPANFKDEEEEIYDQNAFSKNQIGQRNLLSQRVHTSNNQFHILQSHNVISDEDEGLSYSQKMKLNEEKENRYVQQDKGNFISFPNNRMNKTPTNRQRGCNNDNDNMEKIKDCKQNNQKYKSGRYIFNNNI